MNFRKNKKGIVMVMAMVLSIGFSFSQNLEAYNVKIMTYNIWNGFDWGKDSIRKKNCIKWIKSKNPDILALQELCGYDEEQLKKDALKWGHKYVLILKTEGYPTALTSNKPISLIERALDSFWHGLLHCKTYGIDFFIVHLSPSDCTIRLNEAEQITKRIKKIKNDSFVVLGDFNSLSPFDAVWLEQNDSLKVTYKPKNGNENTNLRLGEFDYSVISTFLSAPAVDVCLGKIELNKNYTFPTPALVGKYNNTLQTVMQKRERIDFILASPSMAKSCINVEIFNSDETGLLSDHYPMMAKFYILKE